MFKFRFSQTGWCWLWVSVLVFLTDSCTKMLMMHFFETFETVRITSFFNLTLVYNKGAAFSFLNSAGNWQTWLFGTVAILISIVLLVWLLRLRRHQAWDGVAIAFILGGALGNIWDRVCYGHVVDFIQLHVSHFYWPVFNVADSAICVGAFMLIIKSIFSQKR